MTKHELLPVRFRDEVEVVKLSEKERRISIERGTLEEDHVALLSDPLRGTWIPLTVLQMEIINNLDGTRDAADLTAKVRSVLGVELDQEDVETFVEALQERHYLKTPEALAHIAAIRQKRNVEVRQVWRQMFDQTVSPTYHTLGPAYLERCGHRLVELIADTVDGRVLDLAAGTGNVAVPMAELPARPQVVAIDQSFGMLKHLIARRSPSAGNLGAVLGDVYELPFPAECFNLATCAIAIPFFPNIHSALREAWRVLKPGAQLVVSTIGRGSFYPLGEQILNLVAQERAEDFYNSEEPSLDDNPEEPSLDYAPEEPCLDAGDIPPLMTRAGFGKVRLVEEETVLHFDSGEAFWNSTFWYEGVSILLRELPEDVVESVRKEGIAIADAFCGVNGFDIPLMMLYCFGERLERAAS